MLSINLKFLKNTSAYWISFCILIISVIVSLPIQISWDLYKTNNSNQTLKTSYFYYYDQTDYSRTPVLASILYLSYIIREPFTIIMEAIFNIVLIIYIRNYYKRRQLLNENTPTENQIFFSKSDRNNTIIVLTIGIMNIIINVLIFTRNMLKQNRMDMELSVFLSIYFWNSMKHGLNFFLLLKLNKKFYSNCRVLIPRIKCKCLLFQRPQNRVESLEDQQPIENERIYMRQLEHRNSITITSYL